MKKLVQFIISAAFVVSLPAAAVNLLQVYRQASISDPTFHQAEAQWQAARENLPIAESGYLPQVNLQGDFGGRVLHNKPAGFNNINGFSTTYQFQVDATQPIFDAAAWYQIKNARNVVKAAFATYSAATEDLMLRTAEAYFGVLQAYDQLRYTIQNKRSVYRELVTAEQKFKVGLIAITGVYEARSFYDQAVADEIRDRNNLYNKIEDLRAITGQHYSNMMGLRYQVPLFVPHPNNIQVWQNRAQQQNYSLIAQEYTVRADKELIDEASAGRLPVISAFGSYDRQGSTGHKNLAAIGTNTQQLEVSQYGVQMNFPIIQGGLVSADTRQARYNFAANSAKMVFDDRNVVNQTRQAFLGVRSGISQIKADKQAIISAQNAYKATRAGYEVGTRTMVDVLDDLTQVYQAQQSYYDDQYEYIINLLKLKLAAGNLNYNDLMKINGWLKKRIHFRLPHNIYPRSQMGPVLEMKNPTHRLDFSRTTRFNSPYSILIKTTSNRADARLFIHRQPKMLRPHFHYACHYLEKHHVTCQVLFNDYPSPQQARRAIKRLPAYLRQMKPQVVVLSRPRYPTNALVTLTPPEVTVHADAATRRLIRAKHYSTWASAGRTRERSRSASTSWASKGWKKSALAAVSRHHRSKKISKHRRLALKKKDKSVN